MEVEVSKENICINKLIAEKKELVFVNSDMIVPDSKPDILNTISTSGNVCISKKEVLDERIKIDGNIDTYIMYLPDSKEDNLRALNCRLDFSESISVPGAKEGMNLVTKCVIRDIECKLINGRKITVKAGLEFHIKLYSNENVEIINRINNIDDIQTLQENFNINSLIGSGKTSVYAKDTLNIDSKDEFAEILKVDINIVDKDIKLSYNKVLAKAELEVKIMYLTEDNRIERIVGKTPVVGFIDIQNISEDNICDVNYEIKNMVFRPSPLEEHSIHLEIEIEQSCMVYEEKQISIIQDLYSPTCNLEFSQKRILSIANKTERSKTFSIKEIAEVSDLESENLLDVQIMPNLTNTEISNSTIIYSGDIDLNFIFTNDERLNSRNVKVPFEFFVDNTDETENINVETDIMIEDSNFSIQQRGKAESRIEMNILTKTSKNVGMNIIDNIETSEEQTRNNDEDYDSLILYIVREGDTLWNIAKRFNSTVDELIRMNGIEDESRIDIGQKIYIPKFNYIKKENNENARAEAFV